MNPPNKANEPIFIENIFNWVHVDDSENHEMENLSENYHFHAEKKSTIPKTMGYPHTPPRTPQNYLKKHSREKKLLSETKSTPCLCRQTKGTGQNIHKSQETPIGIPKHSKRHFESEKCLQEFRTPAKAREHRSHRLESGTKELMSKYMKKEYLDDIERLLEESRIKFKNFLLAEKRMSSPARMSMETKLGIYESVVRNWKELLRRYYLMLRTEAPMPLARKLAIEKRIDSLERDVDLLIRHKDIFIGKYCTTLYHEKKNLFS